MGFRISVCLAAMWVCGSVTATTAGAETRLVPKGGNLQKAIDAAQPGDVITLEPNVTFVGNFILPNKGAIGDFITIRSAAPDAALPPDGARMTPEYAALLPKIKSPNNMSALRTAAAANHWKLMFLEFQPNVNGYGDIISLGAGDTTQTQLSQVPYALVLDRVYVHGDPVTGQKRGIALHSRDTDVINSWVSDCKAVGQEAQAISGFNGPGNYVIENNYLEGATQNFLLGGSDPKIANLVTSNVTFRYNHLTKPLAWRDPIATTPTNVVATAAPGAGSLAAGTYYYTVQARVPAGQTNIATSTTSIEVSATVTAGTTGAVTISWTPVAGAQDYLVWGRTSGKPSMSWKTTGPSFVDKGVAGTSGSPASGTLWLVKNIFELKNARHVLVEGNVFENNWVAGQPGFAILFTPRNQSGTAPWVVVQDATFRYNIVRHTAGGVNILGTDNIAPSRRTNNISITNNLLEDVSSTWGSGGRVFQVSDGADRVTIGHNTILTTDSTIVWFYSAPMTSFEYTNNMSLHNAYGINGSGSSSGQAAINTYAPGSIVCANVLAGGKAKLYPVCNYFPTAAEWFAGFKDYAAGDYHLQPEFAAKYPSTDGPDLGADIETINAMTGTALSGRRESPLGCHIVSQRNGGPTLPDGIVNQSYAEAVTCTGGPNQYAWRVIESSLPAGIAFDPVAAIVAGIATADGTGSLTLEAYDPADPYRSVTETLSLTINLPRLVVTVPQPAAGQVGVEFRLSPTATGAMGSTTWTTTDLPAGLTQDPVSGVISGIPTMWGSSTINVQVRDSRNREASQPAAIVVKSAALAIPVATLPHGRLNTMYSVALAATGGTGSTTWSANGNLPAGMSFHDSGTISGVPTKSGTFTFTVTASDTIFPDNIATAALSLTIENRDVVLYTADAIAINGAWSLVADATAAAGRRMANPNASVPKIPAALASPANYFELTFTAEAGLPYHVWIRGIAEKNNWANDSVYVQFSGSVDAAGTAIHRIGSTMGLAINIEEGTNAGLSGWGWADDSYGGFGKPIYFAASGPQTVRVQMREDGVSIDQIVLGADTYATVAPGSTKNDATIVPK